MRRILIERARRKKRIGHGGHLQQAESDCIELVGVGPDEELLQLDEALAELGRVDPDAATLVKLRFFVGLSQGQTAELLGVSRRTADRAWAFARAWLYRVIHSGEEPVGDSRLPKAPAGET
jgi:RNA polymerase sigma factor (TIGR02999 family)